MGDVRPAARRRSRTPVVAEWLKASEAGALLGVHSQTVVRWIRNGRLRGRVTEGGQYRVTRDEVERLAAAQEAQAIAPTHRHKEEPPSASS